MVLELLQEPASFEIELYLVSFLLFFSSFFLSLEDDEDLFQNRLNSSGVAPIIKSYFWIHRREVLLEPIGCLEPPTE